ncbi:hypothetical protein JOB18_036584 [Solea senegalensis]|uniref:Uncharacterized protein n=1 Tax=Solea senegalensis TaxID=28829 RepID=A0AAV6R2Q4_SOLSE|nr:hypothetical protein JOB18_036584 [Solea senegalensis]
MLSKCLLAQIVFNKKHDREASRLTLKTYLKADTGPVNKDIYETLSPVGMGIENRFLLRTGSDCFDSLESFASFANDSLIDCERARMTSPRTLRSLRKIENDRDNFVIAVIMHSSIEFD